MTKAYTKNSIGNKFTRTDMTKAYTKNKNLQLNHANQKKISETLHEHSIARFKFQNIKTS